MTEEQEPEGCPVEFCGCGEEGCYCADTDHYQNTPFALNYGPVYVIQVGGVWWLFEGEVPNKWKRFWMNLLLDIKIKEVT